MNYYVPVLDFPNSIIYLYYLIKYSCAHTLAQKRKTPIRKRFKKFGKDIITYSEKVVTHNLEKKTRTEKKIYKKAIWMNWKQSKEIMKKIIINTRKRQKEKRSICSINKAIDDICNVKVN